MVAIGERSPDNRRRDLSLFFDTGASITTLRADLYPLLGLQRWDQGQRVEAGTGNGIVIVYQYTATLEIFGKVITCPIFLNDRLPDNDYCGGLLGRDTIFNAFGFGFWERTHELYVTGNP